MLRYSLQKAKAMPHKVSSSLVGGKQYKPIELSDTLSAFGLIDKCPPQDAAALKSVGGIFVRSVLMTQHGHEGTLYRVGEYCLVLNSDQEQQIIRLSHIFTMNCRNVSHLC